MVKTWKVKSSKEGVFYQVVMIHEAHWECTCPHYVYRKKMCKHIKIIMKAYDKKNKQNAQSKPTGVKSEKTKVSNNSQGYGEKRDSVPSGEFRRGSINNGDSTKVLQGAEQQGSGRHSNGSNSTKNGVGTSSSNSMVSGPTESSNHTETGRDNELCEQDNERKSQLAKMEKWNLRKTSFSKSLHIKLEELREKYRLETDADNKKTIAAQSTPIKMAIRNENKKAWREKPPFKTDLIEIRKPKKKEIVDHAGDVMAILS